MYQLFNTAIETIWHNSCLLQMSICIIIAEVSKLKTLVMVTELGSMQSRFAFINLCIRLETVLWPLSSVEQLPGGIANSYKRTPFVVDLRYALDETDVGTCDLGWFTIWSQASDQHFTRIELPTDIYVRQNNHEKL